MAKAILSSRQTQAAAEKSYMISKGKLKKVYITFALEDSIVDFYRTFEISIVDFGRIKNVR